MSTSKIWNVDLGKHEGSPPEEARNYQPTSTPAGGWPFGAGAVAVSTPNDGACVVWGDTRRGSTTLSAVPCWVRSAPKGKPDAYLVAFASQRGLPILREQLSGEPILDRSHF